MSRLTVVRSVSANRGTKWSTGKRLSLAVGLALVLLVMLVVTPALAQSTLVQIFYVPITEAQALASMETVHSDATDPVWSYVSIAIGTTGTRINYDQWENGYEANLDSPTDLYSTVNTDGTQIWGNGNCADGFPPNKDGSTTITLANCNANPATVDALASGNVVVLRNSVPAASPAIIDFDGRDKFGATEQIAVSRLYWSSGNCSTTGAGTCLGGAIEVYPTSEWASSYVSPVGVNQTFSDMFTYSAFAVQAFHPGTAVMVDVNGSTAGGATNYTLNEGDSIVVANIQQGATVTSTFPVQVHLLTGDPDSSPYEYSIYTLVPRQQWGASYYSPVGTNSPSFSGSVTQITLYNPGPGTLDVRCDFRTSSTNINNIAVNATQSVAVPNGSGAHCYAVTADNGTVYDAARQFFAIGTVDSAYLQSNSNSGGVWDWGFTLLPNSFLTPQALVGLGIGQDPNSSSTENGSPVWVTPVCSAGTTSTYIYVDRNGDGTPDTVDLNGDNDAADTNVGGLNETTANNGLLVSVLQSVKLRDHTDQDQTGMKIWSKTAANNGGAVGCDLAVVWGEDPNVASQANPGFDVGTTVPPLSSYTVVKTAGLATDADNNGFVTPGDTLTYTVEIKNTGLAPITSLRVTDTVPAFTSYVAGSTYKYTNTTWVQIPDEAGTTALANGEDLAPPDTLPIGGTFRLRFKVTINAMTACSENIINTVSVFALNKEKTAIAITPLDCPTTIELRKSLSPSTDSGRFNLSIAGPGGFSDVATNQGHLGTTGVNTVAAGVYTVTETGGTTPVTNLADYSTGLVCVNNNAASPAVDFTAGGRVTLSEGQEVVCTFTNTRLLPNIAHDKTFVSATAVGDTWDVVYRIVVSNTGAASGVYTLTDQPAFDDDIDINSVSFVSSVPSNGALAGSGPWSLAANRSLNAGASHVYTLTVNVDMDLAGGGGDDSYDRCLPTPDGAPDQGLFNRATLTQPGQPGRDADACGDLPHIVHDKEFVSATAAGGDTWDVVYRIVATNNGGASGTYSLSDQPAMDDDIDINSASFASSVPSGSGLAGSGPWSLATNQSLNAGASHIYTLTVNVGLNLAGGIGNDVYDRCLPTPDGAPDQGLFNRATLTQPGQPGRDADACGDIPNIAHDKEFVSATAAAGDTWNVVYRITVNNNGGASGTYSLSDQPAMDDDIDINSASFASTVPSGSGLAGSGPWSLAANRSLNAGASHVYTLTVNVDMDLAGGGGDDSYDRCLPTPDGAPEQGLFNRATLTQPGQPGRDADACGDLPNIVHDKEFVSTTAAAGDTWDVVYRITVNNNGGASGTYTLSDQPSFDDDIDINSASFASTVPSNGALAGSGPWSLATNQSLNAGASHVYTLTVNVGLDLAGGSGDDSYDRCQPTPDGAPNQGLFNRATLTQPGQPGRDADACGDVPNIVHDKEFVSATAANGGWNVVYRITVNNNGGASGTYTLSDQPSFDDDVTINSASFASTVPSGSGLAGDGPWSLATNQSLNAGASHIYTLTVNVDMNLAGGIGDDNYDRCLPTPDGAPDQGLFNRVTLTQPGQPGRDADACGDVPNIVHDKEFVSATAAAGNTWDVVYRIVATNNGGASGVYTLTDQPAMDNDVTINSASFVSTLDANTTLNSTPWSLATNRSLASGASHVYTLTVNVDMDLAGGSGDDSYDRCLPTPDGAPNQGLFNRATLTQPGQPGRDADACGDVPNIVHDKEFVSATAAAGDTWDVVYRIVATNNGGANGVYSLSDQPAMDNDVTINSASFVSSVPSNGALAGSGPWSLATNQSLNAGASHVYTLTVNVGLNLAGGGGNDVYDRCLPTPDGAPDQGLFNRATLTQPGQPGRDADACGDVPSIVHDKEFVSATAAAGDTWDVVYRITVNNNGGASGVYTLSDQPAFDDDIDINSASFASTVPSGSGLAGDGPWSLATNQSLNAGASRVYTLTVNVGLNLAGGGGNDVYDRCLPTPDGAPDQGLFNRATLTQPGQPGRDADACGDVPNIVHDKEFVSATAAGGDTWDVVYRITVNNTGGASGVYTLSDQPSFDDDIDINGASFASTVPSNGALAGSGPWSLATNQSLAAGASHIYTLTVNVGLDLAGGSGDDSYDRCLPTPDGAPNQGLFNRATLTQPGQPGRDADACGDIPNVTHNKDFVEATEQADGSWNFVYRIVVSNNGGVTGVYDLEDEPIFDDDLTINSASFVSTAPSGGPLAGDGPWTLGSDVGLAAGASHVYTLTVNATLDMAAGAPGDNTYTVCGAAIPGTPRAGEGGFNESRLDGNNDGVFEEIDQACGDIPFINHAKTFISATQQPDLTWSVLYRITVANVGGVTGQYSLQDQPGFDDDIAINSASFVSTLDPSTVLAATPWTLATNRSLAAGASHVYTLTANVALDLAAGSGGDNVYTSCGATNNGDPQAGEGLFNVASLDRNADGVFDVDSDDCGNITTLTHSKQFVSASPAANATWDVIYRIVVDNQGGASGVYTLTDQPAFDDDVAINSASFVSTLDASTALASTPWRLATNRSLAAGGRHVYTMTVNVTLDLTAGSGGNNVYTVCGAGVPGVPQANEGLFNRSGLDVNGDGLPDEVSEDCGDLPYIAHTKTFIVATQQADLSWDVNYRIVVANVGGVAGSYSLSDQPTFDDDVAINNASFVSTLDASTTLTDTPWTLAASRDLDAGAFHVYTLTVNVDLDLADGAGNNIYDRCQTTANGQPGEGLFNNVTLTQPGQPDREADSCGDIPYIVHDKQFVGATAAGDAWEVVYAITVRNDGGALGQYDLTDQPSFDNDVTIESASYVSSVPSDSPLAVTGPWQLGDNVALAAGASHRYTITVNVDLDLTPGSSGDNSYSACGVNTGTPQADEGLFNKSFLDVNNDGVVDQTAEDCGDLPNIVHDKAFVSATAGAGDTWDVVYRITVNNNGGASGTYTLSDQPAMDDDVTINSASFVSTLDGSTTLNSTPWSLATNRSLAAGASHVYTLTVNVGLNLTGGSGDDEYDRCLPTPDRAPDQGLFNRATLTQPGQPGRDADACGDVPNIVHDKEFVSATAANGGWNVVYRIVATNNGGASGVYTLSDQPAMDDDVTINSASFVSSVPSNGALAGSGPWTLATNQSLAAGASHVYTLTVNVRLDLAGGSGDDVYDRCLPTPDGAPDQGLFNQATLTQPGQPGRDADACGDLPNIAHDKEFVSATAAAGDTWDVVYRITVNNNGGASGVYTMSDQPSFDNDVTINSAGFVSSVPSNGALNGSGPWTLATNQSLNAGASHVYTLTVNVDMDLAGGSGDDVYDRCLPTPDGAPNQGLFNRATLTQPGQPGRDADACGDIPNIVHDKEFVSATAAAGDTWDVVYRIVATNNGGASGHYTLTDQPAMDNDVTINSASFVSTLDGSTTLNSTPWSLATNRSLAAGASHIYTLTVNVGLNLAGGSGNDVYDRCQPAPDGAPNQGLFNRATLTQPGQPGRDADACGDVPNITHDKEFVSATAANGGWNVVYRIVATNNGGASGVYTLTDQPAMDDDVTVNSASFVSSVPNNGALNGTGLWSLAANQSLAAGASHIYTLTVNVGLNLAGGAGDDEYDRCLPTPDGAPDQGLFNRATLTQPGQPGRDADACGDLPGLNHDKEFVSATAAAGDTWNVVYRITVNNNGGTSGVYTLSDQPAMDDDVTINSASFVSSVPSNGALAGSGPWSLATNQSLAAGASHVYTLTVNVDMDLAGGGGNDVYDRCLPTPDGAPNQGLFNRATLTQPGQPGRDADACGDLPNIVHDKEFVSATAANGGWNVVYRIVATNNGGASGVYTLTDQPAMDDDVTVNSASFVSSVPSNGALAGSGPWTLATNQSLNAGASHVYTLTVNVGLNLTGGAGNDVYDRCQPTPDGAPDQGLFNRATLTQPGQPGRDADACGDVPNIVHDKEFVSATAAAGNTWNVVYRIVATNNGGASGVYTLSDQPAMDNDVTINSAGFVSTVPSNGALTGSGPWSLAANQNLAAGASHVYTLTVNVGLNLAGGDGNDVYDRCTPAPDGAPHQGLFNRATLTQPGQPGRDADACGDLPGLNHDKEFVSATPAAGNTWDVVYRITVNNNGGASGVYSLSDQPAMDSDVTINSASFVSNVPSNGALAGSGPWSLATDQSLNAGASHVYTLTVNVGLNLAGGSGNDVYDRCQPTPDGAPNQGLFNRVTLTQPGQPGRTADACGDLPNITHNKALAGVTQQPNGSWNLVYRIDVLNNGGAAGQYDLIDRPAFDDDLTINSASFVATAPGLGGALAGTGPWTLANDQNLAAGAIHIYTVTVNATVDLTAGSSGNNVYTRCAAATPGNPQAGEGGFNESLLDRNNDGVPDQIREACGDVPYITHDKSFVAATRQPNGTWNVNYTITVFNSGGATGRYDLVDEPTFDNDLAINSASFVSTVPSGGPLVGAVPWTLANDVSLAAGAAHTYTLTVNVTLDLAAGSGGDNLYTFCAAATPGNPQAGEGAFNESRLDTNNDGTPDQIDEACGDIYYLDLALRKSVASFSETPLVPDLSNVTFRMEIINQGNVPATNVTVVDYVPAGFTFNAADNPGWTGGANPTTVVAGPIQPGDIATVDLVLRLNAGTRGATLANFAEIANDGWPAGSDIDSTPDMQNQETPVKDDVIDEDGKNVPGEDEDDHDAGIISVQVFDLALMKRVAFAPSPIVPGQSKITFAIEVFNQGDITATNVLLTDYVQQGFTFSLADNPGWTAADPLKPTLLITGAIAPGRSAVVNVVLGTTAEGARQVVNNFAEISAADDVTVGNAPPIDVDSTPDSLNQESPVKDDVIDEDGKNVPGQDEDDHDIASLRLPGVGIGGFVWADLDNSGAFQQGETTFDGVTVQLYRAGDTPGVSTPVASQVTANGGNYLFTDLAPGRYFVYIPTPPAGHPLSSTATDTADNQQKYDDNGIQAIIGGALTSPVIDLQPGQEPLPEIDGTDTNIDSTIDFGFLPPVSLGNLIWHDANDNGQRDNGEAGIDGVDVQLFRADQTPGVDTPIATTTTAGGGQYLFSNLTPGEYIVYIPTPPAAYPASSSVTDTADNGQDNDDNGAQATVGGPVTSPTITLTPGQEPTSEDGNANSDLTIDFGFYGPLSLGDIVWHDANNNGQRDNGETGIAGVNVQLFQAGQTPGIDNPVAVDVTDANGNYRFDELRPGQYFVYIPTPPADYPTSSTPTSTADDNVNDDDNGVQASTSAPVTSAVVTLTSGAEPNENGMANLTIDFGFYRFDLALRKTVASLSSTPLAPGVSTITFTIEVINQGDVPASNVTVVDYVPAGLVFEPALNPGWSGAPNPTTVIAGPIASGQSVTIQIVLRVAQGTVGQSIANGAEIAADNQPPGTDSDSRPDTQDQETPVKDDVIDEDAVANPGVDDEDDHDTATITVERFDLALRKRVGAQSDTPLAPGVSTVAFVIQVFNQGDVPASNVTVIDYVPVGLVFEPALNPGWSGSPNPTTVIAGPIQPGQSATVQIVLRAAAGTAGQSLSNGAEIANDNTAGADVDSTPDTQNQETPVKDDVIDENALANPGVDDEDDHDIATVAVGTFDLALRKRVAPGQPSILVAGNSVTSTIEVFNQGDITATNITIVDYIPAGFAISATAPVNAGWVVSGNVAQTTLPGPLAPGASMTRDIVLLVVDAVGVVNNYAEIASANDNIGRPVADVDSTSDTINGNDPYVDDVIDDDGTIDEDDHDGAEITVDRFDMSLIKRLADGQEVQVQTGDDVAYTIQVRNEGSAVATEALVIDYIPSGFVLSPVDTNGWVLSADGRTATNTIAGPIPPGGTASIDIVLRVTAFEPATYINIAEILLVYDEEGNPHNDEDSTPNDDPGDDDIDGDGTPDEDDIDAAVVEIQKPTAITLSSFTANFTGGVIRVLWTTTLELDTMGFHLYRSTTSSVNDAVRITPALIPGLGSDGGAYSFDDTRVSYGVTYWYWLVETETTGTINFYGPVRATAIQGNDPQGRMGIFLPIISR